MARELKENQHVMPVVDIAAGTVTFKIKGHADEVLEWSKLHPDVQKRSGLVGMAQVRIVDAAAIGMTAKDGSIIPEAERIAKKAERIKTLIAHYHTGTAEWSRVSEGGGGKSLTVEAIALVKGMTYEQAEAEVEIIADKHHGGDTKKCLAFLRGAGAVQKAMNDIRASRQKPAAIDADKALEEFGIATAETPDAGETGE